MKLISKLLISLFLVVAGLVVTATSTQAFGTEIIPDFVDESTFLVTIQFTGLAASHEYQICLDTECVITDRLTAIRKTTSSSGFLSITVCGNRENSLKTDCGENDYFHARTYKLWLYDGDDKIAEPSFKVYHYYPSVSLTPQNPKPTDNITISISGRRRPTNSTERNDYEVVIESTDGGGTKREHCLVSPESQNFGTLAVGSYVGHIAEQVTNELNDECGGGFRYYDINFTVEDDADGGTQQTIKDPQNRDNLPGAGGTSGQNPCDPDGDGIADQCPTALGNIPTSVGGFAQKVLNIAIGLAGGIALILMVIGSIRVLTSSGDQQRLAGGRDMIVAAIAGLLFLILAVIILRFIGVEILNLPGLA